MTLEEAREVAEIISQADGGCWQCVKDLTKMAADSFPEFVWTFDDGKAVVERAR